jgi:hypothetical protein
MKAFEVQNQSPGDFLTAVHNALNGRSLGSIASVKRDGSDVVVAFSKLGSSEVRYRVTERDGGFRCEKTSEKIALAHRAFRGEIEGKLGKVLEKLGARVER